MILPPIASLLPHAGNVILLDRVDEYDPESLRASATVRPNVFSEPDGSLAPWMGVEMMAQAVAAWAGCRAHEAGKATPIGFLIGTRRYECAVARFAPGIMLQLLVMRSLEDASGMALFECSIEHQGRRLASARLNVYSPSDAAAFLQEKQ